MNTKFLGKKNTSTVLKYSPNILDLVHRSKIDFEYCYGVDYWNAYEFSFLNNSNQQVFETIEIKIPFDSDFTIESKSLKIYLATFYNKKFKNKSNVYKLIVKDLSKLTNSKVSVRRITQFKSPPKSILLNNVSSNIKKDNVIRYEGFRSICPVTSQPDWANIYLHSSTNSIDPKKIVRLLKSYREKGDFHEDCIGSIFLSLLIDFAMDDITVCGRFLRRGGIDINPIRSTNKKIIFKNFRDFSQ